MKGIDLCCLAILAAGLCAGCPSPSRQGPPQPAPATYPAPVVEQPTAVPAEMSFDGSPVCALGNLYLVLSKSETVALAIGCAPGSSVPRQYQCMVGTGLFARLALTRRAVRSITPSGAAPPPADPSEYEDAVEGVLQCSPAEDSSEVIVTVKDLRFRTTRIRQIGPLKVRLGNPWPA